MENKIKTKLSRVVLANIEDITAYNFGDYNIQVNKWVNFGEKNDYPSYLRNLYLSSATHQEIIDGSANLATGEGVNVVNPEANPLSNKWLNNNFPKKVVKNLISDLKLYGYAVVQVYGGSIVKYSDAIKYRFAPVNEYGEIYSVWYSDDWDNYSYKKNRPVKLPIYKKGCEDELSICLVQLNKKGFQYYSPVDYNGGINYITLESEIGKYHLSSLYNGFAPSYLINYVGDYTPEQMDEIESGLSTKYAGANNAGRVIISYSANQDEKTEITTIEQPNIDSTYQFLSTECSSKILLAHGVTSPLIFGIKGDGTGFGNNADELEKSFYLYYESKLKHYQNYILEMIETIMQGNMLYADVEFKMYNPFANTEDTQKLSKFNNKQKLSETESIKVIKKLDTLKVKLTNNHIILNNEIFDGVVKNNTYYRYVKASDNLNFVNKKFELLTKDDYLFEYDEELIKNTKDYYFEEVTYMKKNKQ